MFLPFLQYGILLWGLTYEFHVNPVSLLQKGVLRAISSENFTSPSTPIFSNLKILKMHDHFNLKLLCMTVSIRSLPLVSILSLH